MTEYKKLLSEVFDEPQCDALLKISELEDARVRARLEELGIETPAEEQLFEIDPEVVKEQRRVAQFRRIWDNNGVVPGSRNRVTYKDLASKDVELFKESQTSYDMPLLIPNVISNIVKEAVEPNQVLTPLLTRINYSGAPNITFPGIGAMSAADVEEGQEYPERSLEMAGTVVCTIGKSGLAVKMTEEMVRYSQFDIMSLNLNAAGRALKRHKEQKIADLITTDATTLYDNEDTSAASTTGRSVAGALNGTLTLNDLFKGWAVLMNQGYVPDTIIMNPFGWLIFAQEPLARLFGFAHGTDLWGAINGSVGNVPQWGGGNPLSKVTIPTAPQNVATTFSNVPSLFPTTFTIVVTPWMDYDATNNRTDFILCQRSELGFLVVDEEVMTEGWNDPSKDIYKVKLRERYGLASSANGGGVGIYKNISLSRGFDFAESIGAYMPITGHSMDMTNDEIYSGSPY
jgi:hypothetical protein